MSLLRSVQVRADPSADWTSPDSDLRLAEVIGALSYALDITEGQPKGHTLRCCRIGMTIGATLGLSPADLQDLYYVLLLKDLGCSSNAARICALYLTDDRSFKADFKLIDGGLPAALRFVMAHTGLKAGMSERFAAIINIIRNGGTIARELIETRCTRGADIARKMRFSEAVADGIASLDEHYDGRGKPVGLTGDTIPMASRIALLAQVADVFFIAGGPQAAGREVRRRAGGWFDPVLARAFAGIAADPAFWEAQSSPVLAELIVALEPLPSRAAVDEALLDDLAEGFAMVIDGKSSFTGNHSERVTFYSDLIANELGFGAAERQRLRRAALLHDIGKLGVSNSILDKPGKLDEQEWIAMRAHSSEGEAILSRIAAFGDLATIAGAHHERLDGKGYPRGLRGSEISTEVRIVSTADVFDALTAERPYRSAMPVATALSIMVAEEGKAFDPRCLRALERGLAKLDRTSAEHE